MNDKATRDGIAIIGMACVYPGAQSPEALWENVLAGRREFRKIPAERLPLDLYHARDPKAADKTYSDEMAVLTDWVFDPLSFQIPPITAEVTDPTHWLALWTAREAFADAGVDLLTSLDRDRIGVVLGNTLGGEFARSAQLRHRWPFVERALRRAAEVVMTDLGPTGLDQLLDEFRHQYLSPLPPITEDSLAGTMANTIAGRICNYFDIGGGGYTVDGACSSSLLALAHACEALESGTLDIVLTGGVDISLDPYELIGFAKARALAMDDIRPYDQRAAGMLPGEGCGLVVLAREHDARRAGRRVHAVIRGWGYSSDGRGGMTAPRREGQVRALRRAYERAGYPISTVRLLEGHGTGTTLGDRVELGAILDVISDAPDAACLIGSIKGNIGHCKAAAGAAGLIKTVMALRRRMLPPTAGCEHPHPLFGRPFGRLAPLLEGMSWDDGLCPRRAAVSAFGFGGSNAHITLEEAGPGAPCGADIALLGSSQSTELLMLSASDRPALVRRLDQLRAIAPRISRADLTDLAGTLARDDAGLGWRLALVAASPSHLVETIDRVLPRISANLEDPRSMESITERGEGVFAGVVQPDAPVPRLVALFPGQGTQWPGMGAHLSSRYPFVREMYDSFDAVSGGSGVKRLTRSDLCQADAAMMATWTRDLSATSVAQPAIVAASLAALRVLEHHGLCPEAVLGHSLGEVTALAAAGCYDDATAVRIATLRGRAMADLELFDPGAMVALGLGHSAVEDLIAPFDPALTVSGFNSPTQTVVSGTSLAVDELVHACTRRRIPCARLVVSHAFHSNLVAPAALRFLHDLSGIPMRPPATMVISTASGDLLPPDADVARLLGEHLRQPVRFMDAVSRVNELSPALWVEVGPGGVLTRLVEEIIGAGKPRVFTMDRPGGDGFAQLNALLGQAFVLGFPVDTARLFAHRFSRPFTLPLYAPRVLVNPCERPAAPRRDTPALQQPAVDVHEAPPTGRTAIFGFVRTWIADRTGYPMESLTSELRLRDDLGLDSIKWTELMHVLATRLNRSLDLSSLSGSLQIGELVDAVLSGDDAEPQPDVAQPGLALRARPLGGVERGGAWVARFEMSTVAMPIEAEPPLLPPRRRTYVVAGDACSRAAALADVLREAGFHPEVIDGGALLHTDRPPDLGAVIWLLPEDEPSLLGDSVDEFEARLARDAEMLFWLARWLVGTPSEYAASVRWFVVRPERAGSAAASSADAGAAFLKSLRLEHPWLLTKWIRVPADWRPEHAAEVVVAELLYGGARVMYRYDAAGRRTGEVAALSRTRRLPLRLDGGDVVVATGGAKGITFELAFVLAEAGVALALVGTSPSADAEVRHHLEQLEAVGARFRYYPCDVTEAGAVRALFDAVEHDLGKVTMILHGAGVSSPASLKQMSIDNYRRCIRVKAIGLFHMLSARPIKQLRAVHVISSVLGYTGMSGQVDYTFANAWLDGALCEVSAAQPGLHSLALGYSVWQETGLGKKLGSVDFLRTLGLTALKSSAGVAAYRAALEGEGADVRHIVTGRLVPDLETVIFPSLPRGRSRFLEQPRRWVPGIEVIVDASLRHDHDIYLGDHVFEGTPILPAVMGLDAMIAAAMACAERDDHPTVEDLTLSRPIIVPRGAEVTLRTYALAQPPERGRIRVRTELRVKGDGFTEACFSATCVFDDDTPIEVKPLEYPLPPSCPIGLDAPPLPGLFQGPLFQHMVGVRRLEAGVTCLVDVYLPDVGAYFATAETERLCTPFPAARDAFFQSLLFLSRRGGLPTNVKRIRFLHPSCAAERVVCRGRVMSDPITDPKMDIDVFTTDGQVIEVLRGVVLEPVHRQ